MSFLSTTSIDPKLITSKDWRDPPKGGNVFDLVAEHDPILVTPSIPYDFSKYTQEETNQLVLDMAATMRYYGGIGLSAVQFGRAENVFVMEIGDDLPLAVFNPKIVHEAETEQAAEEGCLSFPQLLVYVKRPISIRVRFFNLNNEVVTTKFDGLSARVFLHEYDHLQGIVMKNRVSKLKYDLALKSRMKRARS